MELINSIPLVGGFIWTLLSFVVVLSVIIFIHEFGHYIVGRWCGIQAEVFSIGIGPSLTSWRDRRGTRWQIAALPFGGYVKFLGDADASSRTDVAALATMADEERSRSFPGARLYKRALTVAAGPVSNFILSIVIFSGLAMATGIATDTPTIGKLKPLPPAGYQLRPDDVILAVNGVPTPSYDALFEYARTVDPIPPEQIYRVRRDGRVRDARGPFPLLPLIDAVQPQSAAIEAGLRVGDLILAVDGRKITAFRELQEIVAASKGREMKLKVWRNGKMLDFTLKARMMDIPDGKGGFERRALIGITGGLFFAPRTRVPGPIESLTIGLRQVAGIVTSSLSGLGHMLSGAISSCNLQGPVGIAKTSGDAAAQGLGSFIWFIGMLSTAIGLLNIFPIPVLDGGHLVFFAYEAVAGKPPSERAMRWLMTIGLALILTLMAFALTNDFFC